MGETRTEIGENYVKENLQVVLGAFFTIVTLILIGYCLTFVIGETTVDISAYNLFSVPVDTFQPEPVERTIYLTSVFLAPFLVIGFSFGINRLLRKICSWQHIKVFSHLVVAVFALSLGVLLWVGLQKCEYFYLTGNYYYERPLVSLFICLGLIGCFFKFNLGIGSDRFNEGLSLLFNFAYVLLILAVFSLSIFDMNSIVGDYSSVNSNHFDAVFYSVYQVLQGKGLLVDIPNQYGLYPQFLEPIFRIIGLNVFKFSIVMSFLSALCFGILFLFFKNVINNKLIRFFGFTSVLYFPYLFGRTIIDPDPYFQYIPIRFIFPVLLLYLSARYFRSNSKKLYYGIPAVCSIAFLWNTETGILVLLSWLFTLVFIELFNTDYKTALLKIIKHIVVTGFSFALVLLCYYIYSYLRYGAGPKFDFEYQTIFYSLGFFMLPMPLIQPWNIVITSYILGLSYCAKCLISKQETVKVKIIFLLSVLGTGIFSYYQGRSHGFNLVAVWYPAIILAVIYADSLSATIKSNKKDYIGLSILGIMLVFLSSSFFSLIASYDTNYQVVTTRLQLMSSPKSNFIKENVDFIKQNTKIGERILILSYTSGVYFAETQTLPALDTPSFTEMLLKEDLKFVEQNIKEAKIDKVFYDSTFELSGRTAYHTNVLNELKKRYKCRAVGPYMFYYGPK